MLLHKSIVFPVLFRDEGRRLGELKSRMENDLFKLNLNCDAIVGCTALYDQFYSQGSCNDQIIS